jgi:hypothetical protein
MNAALKFFEERNLVDKSSEYTITARSSLQQKERQKMPYSLNSKRVT